MLLWLNIRLSSYDFGAVPMVMKALNSTIRRPLICAPEVVATRLFCKNVDVSYINEKQLGQLPAPQVCPQRARFAVTSNRV
eukprot:SAG31_NODE_150_length_22290_cov_5.975801_18_plen_81_part_00